ncbi:hypothetical protein ARMGADRAFT_657198 [Armillaria gallica]|uniref:Uncharacterized protein n=1 Tax=Armillaria gallica TaxID=47427 RepID=A0A2H3DVF5_ARMGA|nr:hypothetical protein ARMGADRAFT_657198 [Armillaria gallica]
MLRNMTGSRRASRIPHLMLSQVCSAHYPGRRLLMLVSRGERLISSSFLHTKLFVVSTATLATTPFLNPFKVISFYSRNTSFCFQTAPLLIELSDKLYTKYSSPKLLQPHRPSIVGPDHTFMPINKEEHIAPRHTSRISESNSRVNKS